MKDFDSSRKQKQRTADERTFVIGGQTFVARTAVHPSSLAGWDSIDENTGIEQTLETIDQLIIDMIEPDDDSAGRYRAVREQRDDPVSVEDLQDLVRWLIEVQTGRPTGQQSGSSPTPLSIATG